MDAADPFPLECTATDRFMAQPLTIGRPRIFGGSLVAQSLAAACRTIEARECHSMHGYFLASGHIDRPIEYRVERIRDGDSFAARQVTAVQGEHSLFVMLASFQKAEDGLSHQVSMPDVPPPERCPTEERFMFLHGYRSPGEVRRMTDTWAIEIRPVEQIDLVDPEPAPPYRHVWFRSRRALPDDQAVHQTSLAYASDFGLLATSSMPHGRSFLSGLNCSSLDHSLWFHAAVKADQWILFAQESPVASGGRGLNRAHFFDSGGTLIASATQEALMRLTGHR